MLLRHNDLAAFQTEMFYTSLINTATRKIIEAQEYVRLEPYGPMLGVMVCFEVHPNPTSRHVTRSTLLGRRSGSRWIAMKLILDLTTLCVTTGQLCDSAASMMKFCATSLPRMRF